jgi:hypothetical protein
MEMKRKSSVILGVYDLIMGFGATYAGILMIRSNNGIFSGYPPEWLSKLPFTSWLVPGIIAIALFGAGNVAAAIISFIDKNTNSWFASAIMGGILLISLISQVLIVKEWYLATVEFFVLCLVQLILSGITLMLKEPKYA